MSKKKNVAGSITPATSQNEKEKTLQNNINPDKEEQDIHHSPIKLQRSFPTSLKQLHQWCLADNNKQPLNPNGYPIDVTNPANYLSFDEAISAASKICAGVGFILTGTNIVIVDIDHCINPDGTMSRIAAEVLKLLPTYTEISQSKTGLHLIYQDNDIPAGFTGKKGTIEIYADKRYVALTGWKLPDSLDNLVTLDGLTKQLLNTFFPIADFNNIPDDELLEQHSYLSAQSDDQVLQSLQANQKFQQLYAGDISGYPSQSEADGALMLILAAATALNTSQMKRLFSQSALGGRDKWTNRKWYQDYLISGAINFVNSLETDNMDNLNLKHYDQQLFEAEQASYAAQSTRKTGFVELDRKMGGFPPGVYCITAISSAGKTAFSIQLGYQLALQNNTVIYVGYETTRLEVYSRILARIMKQLNPSSNYSAYDIRKNACADDPYYSTARQFIITTNPQFKVWSTPYNVNQLLEKLQHYISQHPNDTPPVIIVDYLQIIPHTGDLKRMIDEELPKIKSFQQSTGSTFLIISSANRSSYRHDMGVEAFKESGVIEFSADVIWVLQYSTLSSISTIDNTRLKLEKHRSPRKMTLKCLKNRFGADYEVQFDYHSKFDWFVESPRTDEDTEETTQHISYVARRKMNHGNTNNQNANN